MKADFAGVRAVKKTFGIRWFLRIGYSDFGDADIGRYADFEKCGIDRCLNSLQKVVR